MFENLQPLGKRIIVRIKEHEEKTSGGIILTTMMSEKNYAMATVVAVPERKEDSIPVDEGDTVLIGKYAGTPVGADLIIIQENEVLAKIKQEDL